MTTESDSMTRLSLNDFYPPKPPEVVPTFVHNIKDDISDEELDRLRARGQAATKSRMDAYDLNDRLYGGGVW